MPVEVEMSERLRRHEFELPIWPGVGDLPLDKRLANLDSLKTFGAAP